MNSALVKKIAVYVAATFLLGAASGGVLGYSRGRHPKYEPVNAGDMSKRVKDKLTRELSLNSEQQGKIFPIIEATTRQIEDLQRRQMQQMEDAIRQSHTNIATFLDDRQKAKFEEMELHRPKFHCHPKPGREAEARR